MSSIRKAIMGLAMILLGASALAQQDLVDAKQQGLVGERPDGLVAVVADSPPDAIRELVERVNAQRMTEYQQIATATEAPIEAVQARAAQQIIDRLPAGQYFMDASGQWRQK